MMFQLLMQESYELGVPVLMQGVAAVGVSIMSVSVESLTQVNLEHLEHKIYHWVITKETC